MRMPILIDEDVHGPLAKALRRVVPPLDVMTVQEAGLREALDAVVLEKAAAMGRIVVSQDIATMPSAAAVRMEAGAGMPGLILLPRRFRIQEALRRFAEVADDYSRDDWEHRVVHLRDS